MNRVLATTITPVLVIAVLALVFLIGRHHNRQCAVYGASSITASRMNGKIVTKKPVETGGKVCR